MLDRLHADEFIWLAHRIRVLPYLGVAGDEVGGETLDQRLRRASHAATEARCRGELHWLRAEADTGYEHLAKRQRTLLRSTVVFSRIRSGEVDLFFQRGNFIACAEPISKALLDREHPYPAMFPLRLVIGPGMEQGLPASG